MSESPRQFVKNVFDHSHSIRRLITEAAFNNDFDRVRPKPSNPTKYSLMGYVATHGGLMNFQETSVI